VKAVLQRAALAAAVLWLAAALLYAGSGRWSIVLLLAPLVFAAGDAWAVRRKARLTAWLDAELLLLVSDADDGQVFRAADAVIVERRERLLGGLPPVLLAQRTLRMPDGQLIQVQAKVRRLGRADEIDWRVERLRPR
jgi:hypothetical protein